MAPSNALSSDHINYLILRYLQEAGHERAATAFYQDWHRPREYRDPEDFPFAPAVNRYELVSIVQDGLAYDEVHSRVRRTDRRFRWISANADQQRRENGISRDESSSRPPSSGNKKKGRVAALGGMRAPDEFPTPAAKRQRIEQTAHLNGDRDAMDVDAPSPSAGEQEDLASAASPAGASEDALEVPAERYDSMDVATQTDVHTGPKTSTLSFTVSKPGARIFHSSFCPSNSGTLLTAGEDLCRFHHVPKTLEAEAAVKTVDHLDEPSLLPNAAVTALAWHPGGRIATCAVDSVRDLPGDKEVSTSTIMDLGGDLGTVRYPPGQSLCLLEPPGLVLCIRYSPSGSHLLVARTNLKRGLVQIWETQPDPEQAHKRHEPIAWRIFDRQVFDATWTGEDSFTVCGDKGLSSSYRISQPSERLTNGFTPETTAVHNVREERPQLVPGTTTWDKVRHAEHHHLTILASTQDRRLVVASDSADDAKVADIQLPEGLAALALQPFNSSEQRITLAAAFQDGLTMLYELTHREQRISCDRVCSLDLADGPALALAWSPNGDFLAVAGTDMAKIWRLDLDALDTRPLVTWRNPPEEINGEVNGKAHEAMTEPCLSWTPDGERLAFAVDKQVSSFAFVNGGMMLTGMADGRDIFPPAAGFAVFG